MTDKQIITDICPYQGECSVSGCKRNDDGCFVRQLCEERDRAEKLIIELNETIQAKEQECEKLKEAIDGLLKIQYQLADSCNKYVQTLTEIREIAEGMHDLWINKTPYTDMDNLVKHLLECELNRIRCKLDETSEYEANNDR